MEKEKPEHIWMEEEQLRLRDQDFRCPYCKEGTTPINGYGNDYYKEGYVMIHCKKHGLILFVRKFRGFLRQEEYWVGRRTTSNDFRCQDCVHWNINKFSEEDENKVSKACDVDIPLVENPGFDIQYNFRMGHTTACKNFKHKEVGDDIITKEEKEELIAGNNKYNLNGESE